MSLSNLQLLNVLLYVAEHGRKWRGLPTQFGNWHAIYTRMNRWSEVGVMDRVFEKPQLEQIVRIKIEAIALDSTSVKVHPDGIGALKNGPQAIGKSRGRWNTKIHLVAADARTAITFALSPGHAHDAPAGRELLRDLPPMPPGMPLLMDRAYEGNETKQLVLQLGMVPIVPPKSNRVDPWRYDRNGAQEAQRDSGWPTIHALIWPLPHRLPITPTLRHHKILCEILCRLTDALSGDITRLGRSRLVEWCLPRCNIADHDRGLRWVVEDAE